MWYNLSEEGEASFCSHSVTDEVYPRECVGVQLLQRWPFSSGQGTEGVLQAKVAIVDLPVRRDEVARFTQADPTLQFAQASAQPQTSPAMEKGPIFTLTQRILHQWCEGRSQLIVPTPL